MTIPAHLAELDWYVHWYVRYQAWLADNTKPKPDLRGADLTGASLYGADLYGAYLYGAYLAAGDKIRAKRIYML